MGQTKWPEWGPWLRFAVVLLGAASTHHGYECGPAAACQVKAQSSVSDVAANLEAGARDTYEPLSLCPVPELGARDPAPEAVGPAEVSRFQARGFTLRVSDRRLLKEWHPG